MQLSHLEYRHRQVNGPATYHKRAIYVPLIGNILEDVRVGFPDETLQLFESSILFPISNFNSDDLLNTISQIATKYSPFFSSSVGTIERNIKTHAAQMLLNRLVVVSPILIRSYAFFSIFSSHCLHPLPQMNVVGQHTGS